MKMQVFSVYDAVAELFAEPFYAQNVQSGIRAFGHAVRTQERLKQYPEDYSLFHIGEFDQELGELQGFAKPHKVSMATNFTEGFGNQLEIPATVES